MKRLPDHGKDTAGCRAKDAFGHGTFGQGLSAKISCSEHGDPSNLAGPYLGAMVNQPPCCPH